MPELWDLYDDNMTRTGFLHERGKEIPQGFYHLVVSVWLVNRKGQYLMSKRHPSKPYPGYWECTGGSALAGESSLQCALREVKEELGILLDCDTGKLLYHTRRDNCQDFYDVWLFQSEVCEDNLVLQADEVVNAHWMGKSIIRDLQRDGKLHPLIDYFNQYLF